MNFHTLGIFSFCALVSAAVTYSPDADAFYRAQSAYYCVPLGAVDTSSTAYTLENPSCTAILGLVCGVPNDTNLAITGINSLHVTGYANGAANGTIGVGTYACLSYAAGTAPGGTCSAVAASTTSGWYDLTPSTSVWTGAGSNDTPYVFTLLGEGINSGSCGNFNTMATYRVSS